MLRPVPASTSRRRSVAALVTVGLLATGLTSTSLTGVSVASTPTMTATPAGTAAAAPSAAASPSSLAAGTHILDQASYLSGFNDKQWYVDNVPFIDVPDKSVQDVYYYRWRVWKEHLRYTNPTDGWILTEFLDCCGYAAPYQAVNAAAGHHISEGRWVRDRSYLDDYIKFWLTGPGAGAKPATEGVNPDTTDWAHEYSFWLATAAYQRAQVTGDFSELTALLPQLERQYAGWDKQFNSQLGLYWSVPVWDAMELSASSYQSNDPYHGGAGYRPTLNSYQYGDALAISRLAAMTGDTATANSYAAKAAQLKAAIHTWLWDPARGFYYTMQRDNNPAHALLDTREEIGYLPWQFGAALDSDSTAWAQLTDPQGFAAAYGPTTAERRSPLFMHDADGCCRWDGPSWPFSTAQTLSGLANQLDDYAAQTTVSKVDYAAALHTYAATQYRNGQPYVAEAHAPDDNRWIYDGNNHSEDYNHSTYNDLVLSGLLGLRAQDGANLKLKPLTPASWDHWAVENAPYHGHNVTVLWDADGTHYKSGTGMRVYVDGLLVRTSATVTAMTVPVGPAKAGVTTQLANDAANPLRQGYPKPIASGTWRNDDPWSGIDGKVWFTEVPENTRWTNYSSPNAQDYYGVDFGIPTIVGDIRFYGYDDGGGVRPAAAYDLQYQKADGSWATVPNQTHSPQQPVGNGVNRITFPSLTTTSVRLMFTNAQGAYVGVTELQSWSASSNDATVAVGPLATDGTVVMDGATPVTVTVTNTTAHKFTGASMSLAVPAGWTSAPIDASAARMIAPGASSVSHYAVTPPAGAVGVDSDVVASATYTENTGAVLTTHARQRVSVAFNPANYGTLLVSDHFTTDTRGNYTALQPFPGEVVPALTAGSGRLTATASQKFFTLLDRGVTPASIDSVVIVDPAAYIGTASSEDSLFVGLARDNVTYVGGWYNNHFESSGIDLRVNGNFRSTGSGGYNDQVVIAPGDRFAFQVHGTTVTTWFEHGGAWSRIAAGDVSGSVGATELSGWHVMFGLRGDSGNLSVSGFEARAAG